MANLSVSGKVSGHRSAFSQTVNLLSQYVKEKKAIGDLSSFGNCDERGQNNTFHPTTMNFFPVNKKSGEEPIRSMNLFPQQACFASQASEPQSSQQLTIFYGGQVIVFNDLPAHKAKEIMEIAARGVTQNSNTNTIPAVNTTNTMIAADKNTLSPPSLNEQSTTPIVTDLPIARKASLHRFLEKRKDRIKAKAPYNTSKADDETPLKRDQSNSWLGLAAAAPRS